MADAQLSPILDYSTTVPAPKAVYDAEGNISFEIDSTSTVSLKVSSEFTNYVAPTVPFGGKSNLGLVQSLSGQPILFSIGTDDHLYCLTLLSNSSEQWSTFDITPGTAKKAITFDVKQSSSKIVLSVALQGTMGSDVYTFVCETEVFSPSNIEWVSRPASHIGGSRVVNTLSCGGGSTQLHPTIIVGTVETESRVATFYTIDTDPSNATPWTPHALADKASIILDVAPGLLPDGLGVGTYTLYTVSGGPVRCVFNKKDAAPVRYMDLEPLGEVRSFFSAITPFQEGYTDLFVAGSKGIGYFNHIRHQVPQVILPEISFRQVVASEYATKIVLFAISDTGELYYIEGTRRAKVEFLASGYPIRAGIEKLSVQYNTAANSTELMYIDNAARTRIKHLWRDPASFSWFDSVISVKPADGNMQKTMTYPAYITSITVSSKATGASVGAGYPCTLSSDWLHVIVNERAQTLTARPIEIKTDIMGRITIVQPANTSLSGPPYRFSLNLFGNATIDVHPTQRIVTQMARYTTVESLQNAKTTDGRPITFNADATKLSDTAEMLGKVGGLVHIVDPEAGGKIIPDAKERALTLQKANVVDEDWIESTLEFMGDMWEMIKQGLKKVFSVTCKVVGTVVRVVVKLARQTISFIVSTVHSVLKAVSGFLQDTLGITLLEDFLDWLGFIFDWENVKKTQTGLVKFVNGTLTSIVDGYTILRPVLINLLDGARAKLAEVIEDRRIDPDRPQTGSNPLGFLSWIFDNPIISFLMKCSPINWLMTQLDDVVGDEIKLPNLSPLIETLRTKLGELLRKELEVIGRLGKDVLEKLKAFIAGTASFVETLRDLLGGSIWTIYDLFQNLFITAFDVVAPLVSAFIDVLNFELKLPIISDMWDALVDDIPMTLMNVFTLLPAVVMTIFYGTIHKKLPFDDGALGDPMQYVLKKEMMQKSVNSLMRQGFKNTTPPTTFSGATSMVPGVSLEKVQLQQLVDSRTIDISEKSGTQDIAIEHEWSSITVAGLATNNFQVPFATSSLTKSPHTPESEEDDESLIHLCEQIQIFGGLISSIFNTAMTGIEVLLYRRAGHNKEGGPILGEGQHDHSGLHKLAQVFEVLSVLASLAESIGACINPHFHSGWGPVVPVLKCLGAFGQVGSLFVTDNNVRAGTNMYGVFVKTGLAGLAEVVMFGFGPKGSVSRFGCEVSETCAAYARCAATFPGPPPPFNYYCLGANAALDVTALGFAIAWKVNVDN